MKITRFLAAALGVAAILLSACRQAEVPKASGEGDALVSGAQDSDGAVTASFSDGQLVTGDDDLWYITSGLGRIEVKSNAGWTNITDTTASLEAAGSDKMLKLALNLTGGSQASPKQFEATYAFDTPPSLLSSVWETKMYFPPVYSTPGETKYPLLALYGKTGSTWSGKKLVELNTLQIGSGWKVLKVDLAQSKFFINGVDKTTAEGVTADFSQVTASFGDVRGITLAFYAEDINAGMKGAFAVDYLNVTGIAAAQAAAPVITNTNNAVTITSATEGATLYYTTNGDTPTSSSTKYSGAVTITADTVFKAFAAKTGMTDSPVTTASVTYIDLASDLTLDPEGVTFPFSSAITGVSDDGSDYGTSGSRFTWALETAEGADGVLVIEGAATAPTAATQSVFTLQLPSALASPASISFRIKVPAGMASDWWQSLDVVARLGDNWTWTQSDSSIKFPDSGQAVGAFAADEWKTITLNAAAFSGDSLADLRAITFKLYRNFATDSSQATSLDDVLIDWLSVQ